MLSDKEFFLKLKQYIEDVEHQIDGEWGNCRSVEQLISDVAMPDLYFQVLQRITSVAPPATEPGEVAELVDRLGWIAAQLGDIGWSDDSASVARAATLLQQQQHLLGLACAELDAFMEQQATDEELQPVNVIFAGAPGPGNDCVFVEVETDDGRSVRAGKWSQRPNGYWALRFEAAWGRPAIKPEVPPMPVPVA
jgi:hypothetical protein